MVKLKNRNAFGKIQRIVNCALVVVVINSSPLAEDTFGEITFI